MHLQQLELDVLLDIFCKLDPISLASVGCCSRSLWQVVRRVELWQPLCQERWSHLNTYMFPLPAGPQLALGQESPAHTAAGSQAGLGRSNTAVTQQHSGRSISPEAPPPPAPRQPDTSCNWRKLYAYANGWGSTPRFDSSQVSQTVAGHDNATACLVSAGEVFGSSLNSAQDIIVVARTAVDDARLDIHSLPRDRQQQGKLVVSVRSPFIESLCPLPAGRLAASSEYNIHLYQSSSDGEMLAKTSTFGSGCGDRCVKYEMPNPAGPALLKACSSCSCVLLVRPGTH